MTLIDLLSPAVLRWAGTVRTVLWMLRNQPPRDFFCLIQIHWQAWWTATCARANYNFLKDQDVRRRKRSDRVFVFGSGYSLNDIPEAEWQKIAACDSIAFSGSFHLRKIPVTYGLLRAWNETVDGILNWQRDADEVLQMIGNNPFLDGCIFFLQKGFTAIFCNQLLGHGLWDKWRPTCLFYSDKVSRLPHRAFRHGLVHGMSTLCSAISLATALGYKEIVLVGVDLYDSRYFWLPPDKTLGWSETEQKLVAAERTVRGADVSSLHNTVHNGVIDYLGNWRHFLETRYGVQLFVYNPRSLLTKTLPVFSWR